MSTPTPRLELRAFAPDMAFIEHRMRGLATCRGIDESREIYILGARCEERNVKIRDGRLELKLLEARDGDLERWRPA